MFTIKIPPHGKSMYAGRFSATFSPRAGEASTKLSYCNGRIGAGSSNITPYMVWPYGRPRWVAQTMRHLGSLRVQRENEAGESREQDKARSIGDGKQEWVGLTRDSVLGLAFLSSGTSEARARESRFLPLVGMTTVWVPGRCVGSSGDRLSNGAGDRWLRRALH
jgi:hypothetical protein